jgi:hypothetical protein
LTYTIRSNCVSSIVKVLNISFRLCMYVMQTPPKQRTLSATEMASLARRLKNKPHSDDFWALSEQQLAGLAWTAPTPSLPFAPSDKQLNEHHMREALAAQAKVGARAWARAGGVDDAEATGRRGIAAGIRVLATELTASLGSLKSVNDMQQRLLRGQLEPAHDDSKSASQQQLSAERSSNLQLRDASDTSSSSSSGAVAEANISVGAHHHHHQQQPHELRSNDSAEPLNDRAGSLSAAPVQSGSTSNVSNGVQHTRDAVAEEDESLGVVSELAAPQLPCLAVQTVQPQSALFSLRWQQQQQQQQQQQHTRSLIGLQGTGVHSSAGAADKRQHVTTLHRPVFITDAMRRALTQSAALASAAVQSSNE